MQLGTGFKEQIASDLASQYNSAYSQLRQKESSKLGELQTSYLQTLAQQEEALAEQGERFAEIESALYDYMGITDTSLLEQEYGADGGLGFFEMTEPGNYKITERGKLAFDKALNDYYNATQKDRGQLFTEYLAEQDVELLDWYKQNSDIVKQLVGGLESGDISYSEEDIINKEILDLNYDYSDFISSEKSRDVNYLRTVKQKVDNITKMSNNISSSGDTTTESNINKYMDDIFGKKLKGGVASADTVKDTVSVYYVLTDYKTGESLWDKSDIDIMTRNGFKITKSDAGVNRLTYRGSVKNLKKYMLNILKEKGV